MTYSTFKIGTAIFFDLLLFWILVTSPCQLPSYVFQIDQSCCLMTTNRSKKISSMSKGYKVWWTPTFQSFEIQRLTVPLCSDLKLLKWDVVLGRVSWVPMNIWISRKFTYIGLKWEVKPDFWKEVNPWNEILTSPLFYKSILLIKRLAGSLR